MSIAPLTVQESEFCTVTASHAHSPSRSLAPAGKMPSMAIALIFGVAFAALCVWRTVRIINRKERWAKWTLAGVIALPILYPLSEGPVAWIWVHAVPDSLSPRFADFRLATYRPLNSLLAELPPRPPDRGKKMLHTFGEASRAQRLHWAYVRLWVSADETTERWSKDQRQRWGRYDR